MTDAGADYVLALKGIQETLRVAVTLFLEDPDTPVATDTQITRDRGRSLAQPWPGLAAVGQVTAQRTIGDATSLETRYYLLSRAWPPAEVNALARGHWAVENRLHWSLDVIFKEDQARNRKGHCTRNMALLWKLALNLARQEPGKGPCGAN